MYFFQNLFSKSVMLLLYIFLLFGYAESNRIRRIVGGEPAKAPTIDDPVVFVKFAGRSARIEGVKDLSFYLFKGLRYGHPPLENERFLRPREYFLNGNVNATAYPPPCMQPVPGETKIIGNEDCLFLNVFTPMLPTGMEGLPVMIWIHGGNFRYGSGSQYGVKYLVGKQLIVVTIQYRLGVLGFLSTGDKQLPGNAGIWDMVLAVQWTRNYIGFFGGNPHRIVVMGHGTGANGALLMSLSEVAKGRISGVIAMSGTPVTRFGTNDKPKDTAGMVAQYNGCPTTTSLTMVRCLQNLSPEDLIKSDEVVDRQYLQQNGLERGFRGRSSRPVDEGYNDGRTLPGVIQDQPMNTLHQQKQPDIPLLIGVVKDETRRACEGPYKHEIHNKLKTVPGFLNEVLITNLQKTIRFGKQSNTSNDIFSKIDPIQFTKYIEIGKNNFAEGLLKIAEITSDALFNVPAFLTIDLWSKKKSPTFLYSFDYVGNREKAPIFLNGIPLVGNMSNENQKCDFVSHGDELSYLFEPQDVYGVPMKRNVMSTPNDEKVADHFNVMITDFIRYGKISSNGKNVQSYSSTTNNYFQVNLNSKENKNFRYCQIALWCGLLQRLQSTTCSLFKVLDTQLKNIDRFFDTTLTKPVNKSSFEYVTGTKDSIDKVIKNPLGIVGLG